MVHSRLYLPVLWYKGSTVRVAAWAMNQLEDHLLSRLEDEMSSRAVDDIDWIRVNAWTVPHL